MSIDRRGRSQSYARCMACREGRMVFHRMYRGVRVLVCDECGSSAQEEVDDDGVTFGHLDYERGCLEKAGRPLASKRGWHAYGAS